MTVDMKYLGMKTGAEDSCAVSGPPTGDDISMMKMLMRNNNYLLNQLVSYQLRIMR